jgi:hypothetical protein
VSSFALNSTSSSSPSPACGLASPADGVFCSCCVDAVGGGRRRCRPFGGASGDGCGCTSCRPQGERGRWHGRVQRLLRRGLHVCDPLLPEGALPRLRQRAPHVALPELPLVPHAPADVGWSGGGSHASVCGLGGDGVEGEGGHDDLRVGRSERAVGVFRFLFLCCLATRRWADRGSLV